MADRAVRKAAGTGGQAKTSTAWVITKPMTAIELSGATPLRVVGSGMAVAYSQRKFRARGADSALPMRARNRVPNPIGSGVSNSTPAIAGLNDGSLRESATVSNTCSTGAAMRT